MMRIGIDLGGTKTEGIALGGDGTELLRRRVPSPRGDYRATVDTIRDLVTWLEQETGQRGTVGIGTPGAISPRTGLLKNSNSTWLNGMPFDRDLAEALRRPVRLQNDANCLAVSEAVDGAGAGAHCVFAMIIGTGCGAGIAIDGRALTGANAIGGECGHNPLPWPTHQELDEAAECYCGLRGCLETWISGTGFQRDYRHRTGREATGADIVALAERGDAVAQATLNAYRDRLARALASVCNIIDPDVIVLGGGMSNVEHVYRGLGDAVARYTFTDHLATPIRQAVHGDSSGVRGAAWLYAPGESDGLAAA